MESSGQDLFDRLPDDVVLSIFDRLQDTRSLCVSMSVCKRFHSIAPQVVDIYLRVPHKKSAAASDQETHKNSFKNLLTKTLSRPFHFISQMIKPKPKNEPENDPSGFYVPNQILKSFVQVRALHLKLPCNGYHKPGSNKTGKTGKKTSLLKWKADFGREMHSCVILGARSWSDDRREDEIEISSQESETPFLREDELKLRIVWTISCLIAASARHFLVQETVRALDKIERVEVSDESEQGRLCMNKQEIMEMKEMEGRSLLGDEVLEYRSKVPALRMKMWYLERVEVGGKVMEGGTLVVIRPVDGGGRAAAEADMVAGAFGEDKALDEAVRKLMVAKRCYTLEMNSF